MAKINMKEVRKYWNKVDEERRKDPKRRRRRQFVECLRYYRKKGGIKYLDKQIKLYKNRIKSLQEVRRVLKLNITNER